MDDAGHFVEGARFISFSDFEDALFEYETKVCHIFTKKNTKTLPNNQRIQYASANFTCRHSGSFKSKGKNIRRTTSQKSECPAEIKVKADKDGRYVTIIELKEEHNHDCLEIEEVEVIIHESKKKRAEKRNKGHSTPDTETGRRRSILHPVLNGLLDTLLSASAQSFDENMTIVSNVLKRCRESETDDLGENAANDNNGTNDSEKMDVNIEYDVPSFHDSGSFDSTLFDGVNVVETTNQIVLNRNMDFVTSTEERTGTASPANPVDLFEEADSTPNKTRTTSTEGLFQGDEISEPSISNKGTNSAIGQRKPLITAIEEILPRDDCSIQSITSRPRPSHLESQSDAVQASFANIELNSAPCNGSDIEDAVSNEKKTSSNKTNFPESSTAVSSSFTRDGKLLSSIATFEAESGQANPKMTEVETTKSAVQSITSQIDIAAIKMPKRAQVKGRPKGAVTTVIGLTKTSTKKNKIIPTSFNSKQEDQKKMDILKWLAISDEKIERFNGEHLFGKEEVNFSNLPDSLVDESVDIKVVVSYFDKEAFSALINAIELKKRINFFTCKNSRKEISGKSVFGDGCLMWHHYSCVNIKRKPKAKEWFCPQCNPKH